MSSYTVSLQSADSHACCCVGPQNGDPLCPCQMRSVKIVDGRYIKTQDLGPVSPTVDNRIFKDTSAIDTELAKLLREAVTT